MLTYHLHFVRLQFLIIAHNRHQFSDEGLRHKGIYASLVYLGLLKSLNHNIPI